ncbi:MAG: hypothetical protein N2385_10840 [Chloroflexus sp.]|nr:hypothetical protein [Chloroflexus sp.]
MSELDDALAQESWSLREHLAAGSDASLREPALPRLALLMVSRSGGLRFTSRTITIYHNGLVAGDDPSRRLRRLPPLAIARLYHTLLRARPCRLPSRIEPAPDGYVYSFHARIGERICRFEVAAYNAPPAVRDLLRLVQQAGL